MADQDSEKTQARQYYDQAAHTLFTVLDRPDPDPDVWDAAWETFDLATGRLRAAWGQGESTD